MPSFNQRGIAHLLLLVLLLAGIGLGVYLVGQRTNILPHADEPISGPIPDLNGSTDEMYSMSWRRESTDSGNLFVEIAVDSSREAANTFSTKLAFNPDKLQVVEIIIDKSKGSILDQVDESYFDNNTGEIDITGGLPDPGFKGRDGKIALLVFNVKQPGSTSINFGNGTSILSNETGTNILGSVVDATIPLDNLVILDDPLRFCSSNSDCPRGYYCPISGCSPRVPGIACDPVCTPITDCAPAPFCPPGTQLIHGDPQDGRDCPVYSCVEEPPSSCILKSASWILNDNPVKKGTQVGLQVLGDANCAGKTVSFEIREDDGVLGWNRVASNPNRAVFDSNGKAVTTWLAEFQQDGFYGVNNPPEYYFIAKYPISIGDGGLIRSSKPELKVNNLRSGEFLNGDGNKDGKLDKSDLAILRKWWSKTSGFPQESDLNDDGIINSYDYLGLRNILIEAGVIRKTPAIVTPPNLSWQTNLLSKAIRLYDTRPNSGHDGANQPLKGHSAPSSFQIAGKGGVPADANGALVNITVSSSTDGWMAAWPTGERQPKTSVMNYNANSYQAVTTFVKLNATGSLDLGGESGANVIIDVLGYTVSSSVTSLFDETTLLNVPTRVIDTRTDVNGSLRGYLSPRTYILAGKGGIPSNASAVIANITTTDHAQDGWITFWPSGNPKPETSNLYYQKSKPAMANFAVLKLGSNGGIDVVGGNGVNVLIDVAGYIIKGVGEVSNPAGQIHLLPQSARIVDTRPNSGLDGSGVPLKGSSIPNKYTIAGIANVPGDTVGAIITVTALNYTGNSWVSVFPAGTISGTSNLSLSSGQAAIANTAVVKLNNRAIDVVGPQGTNVLIDVIGYISP